ncbi:hypothetical protein [Glycomyces tenuis]|uniref:hypothetical protein n=1 Tax=Glycomyces tenuis TaxID=58116 RepID=UPI00041D2412|nr:hypothetical protein [Glycomyces tenuis]
MSGFDIDTDGLDKGGQGVAATAGGFFAAIDAFASRIEGVTEACGSDEIGGLIEQAHAEIFAWAKECFAEAARSMADAGIDVRDFAAQHLNTDNEISRAFVQIAPRWKAVPEGDHASLRTGGPARHPRIRMAAVERGQPDGLRPGLDGIRERADRHPQ